MNILHIISQHPEATGSGYYLQNIMRQAAAAGHRNLLVAGLSGDQTPRLDGIDAGDCRFVRFSGPDLDFTIPGMSDVMPYPSSRFSELSADQIERYRNAFGTAIATAAETAAIDIVHSHHLWLVTAVARAALPGLPLVASCHSTDLRQYVLCPHLQATVRRGFRDVDHILALDNDQTDQIRALYNIDPDRITIVGAGFDKQIFHFEMKPASPPTQLLYAGKLSFAKGVDWLLRVFANLSDESLHLHLAGSGHGEEAKQCLEDAAALWNRVTVHGVLSQDELARLMRRSHLFILPSFYEGRPLVLLEAMACGCRIVTTGLQGSRALLAGVPSDLVGYVDLPPQHAVDRPNESSWPLLDARLTATLQQMIEHVDRSPSPRLEQIEPITGRWTWQTVFSAIADVYRQTRKGRRKN